ncbi:hypothetical protein B0H13DRAFT_2367311 [Mycena leptocephala]|nr:hypothetical protein B0H13DRAFT_2367311 [Mycena leptocephala]
MSSPNKLAEYTLLREAFEKHAGCSVLLQEYSSPIDKHKVQIHESGGVAIKLIPFLDQIMAKENEPLRELLFTVRGLFHELYHSVEGSNGKLTYPPSYDGVRQLTFKIQEERNLKKAAAAKKKLARAAAKQAAAANSEDETAGLFKEAPASVVKIFINTLSRSLDQMNIDDDGDKDSMIPKDLHFHKKVKVAHDHSGCTPHGPQGCADPSLAGAPFKLVTEKGKRSRPMDYDETAFLTEALQNLSSGPSSSFIMEEARNIAALPAEVFVTPATIKKRLYQLMVEVAVLNEKIKSDLSVRANHVEDAAELTERLAEMEPIVVE